MDFSVVSQLTNRYRINKSQNKMKINKSSEAKVHLEVLGQVLAENGAEGKSNIAAHSHPDKFMI